MPSMGLLFAMLSSLPTLAGESELPDSSSRGRRRAGMTPNRRIGAFLTRGGSSLPMRMPLCSVREYEFCVCEYRRLVRRQNCNESCPHCGHRSDFVLDRL